MIAAKRYAPIKFIRLISLLIFVKGDGDSEIALVIEDDDMFASTMDGQPYQASRFAATLRRQLYKGKLPPEARMSPLINTSPEHLGLIEPQVADSRDPEITSFMRPAPYPNKDQTRTYEDGLVADPLSDATNSLWMSTARKNREVFTELFHPLPSNLVQNWDAYEACHHRLPLLSFVR